MTIRQYIETHGLTEKQVDWNPDMIGITPSHKLRVFISPNGNRCVIFNDSTGMFRIGYQDVVNLWSDWETHLEGVNLAATRLF